MERAQGRFQQGGLSSTPNGGGTRTSHEAGRVASMPRVNDSGFLAGSEPACRWRKNWQNVL